MPHTRKPTIDFYVPKYMAQSSNLSLEGKHVVVSHHFSCIEYFTDLSLQVRQWLSSVFTSDQRITEYPMNAQAIDVFYHAALEAKQNETRFQLVAQGYRQKAEEYKAEGIKCLYKYIIAFRCFNVIPLHYARAQQIISTCATQNVETNLESYNIYVTIPLMGLNSLLV